MNYPTQQAPVRNVVVDLETLAKKENAAILSIGLVEVDLTAGFIGSTLYVELDLAQSQRYGFDLDADTVMWWMQQSDEAKQLFARCNEKDALPVPAALMQVSEFILGEPADEDYGEVPNPRVNLWGNGSSFDNVILRNAYDRCGITPPWAFWRDRDLRTAKDMVEALTGKAFTKRVPGVPHNALEDAVAQAMDLCDIYKIVRSHKGVQAYVEAAKE